MAIKTQGSLITDLSPTQGDASWYGLRGWIECSYRDLKSDGWQWQKTRLTNPERAERQWLAMAVALLWTLSQDLEDEQALLELQQPIPQTQIQEAQRKSVSSTNVNHRAVRQLSSFVNGLLTILEHLLNDLPITIGCLKPWPIGHATRTIFKTFHSSFSPNSS
ncbi:transposase [Moorena sp. SIO3I6]|uniref:transposase n=1 Tax=Moorena sp. SIO3I6 TaxID=2607831 RepID=UPI0025F2F80E|nr:transposase [Moorena sp. SIO3I6]